VALNLVADRVIGSLRRPGGNLTGIMLFANELTPKRLDLLRELVPQVRVVALLVNPNNQNTERTVRDVQEAAREKEVQLQVLQAGSESEIDAAFNSLDQLHVGALVIADEPFLSSQREQLVALASSYAVPVIYAYRQAPVAGGLISYGVSSGAAKEAGIYAGKILNGAKPADLPIQRPTKFELVINLKTAKALGLTVPQSLLARADEVIE
jgi:putative ABC transport system substrate-binding protein